MTTDRATTLDAILESLAEPFPPAAIKRRQGGGGQSFSYIEGETCIRRLNRVAGAWDFRIVRFETHGELFLAIGELTIPGLGTRTGIGVQKVSERGGEDLVKGVSTDALKKAATLFGVALDLYGPDIEHGQPTQRQEPTPIASDRHRLADTLPFNEVGDPATRPAMLATEPQIKAIYAIGRGNLSLSEEEIHEEAERTFGVKSLHELSRRQASEFIDALKNGAKAAATGAP